MTRQQAATFATLNDDGLRAHFARRVRQACEVRGVTLKGLSRTSDDWSRWAISNVAHRQVDKVSASELLRFCRAVDVHPAEMLVRAKHRHWARWPADHPDVDAWEWGARERLREWRLEAGLGTPALAQLADFGQASLVRLENGRYKTLDLITLQRLVRPLGRTLLELFYKVGADGREEDDDAA